MSILSNNENTAFQSFLSTMDYADSDQVAPEWSMYSAPDVLHDDLDPSHLQKRDLTKATKDLMSLESDRWNNGSGQGHQSQSISSYNSSGHHLNYQYDNHDNPPQHASTPHMAYTSHQNDLFPYVSKQYSQQSHQHYPEHALPPINTYPSSGPSSRASATPPISTSSGHSYQIATPSLPSPNQPFMPISGSASAPYHFSRSVPSPAPSLPSSHRASPALPPSLSHLHKRSTYDEPHHNKRPRLSPVTVPTGSGFSYPLQRSRSHPTPNGSISHPRSLSSQHVPNHLIHPHVAMHHSRSSSVASSRPGSSHMTHPHVIGGSTKPALLSPSQKKANHIQSEQKRRANIRRGYEALCETVPALREAIREEEAAKNGKNSEDGMDIDADGKRRSSRPKRSRARVANSGKEDESSKSDGRAGPRSENVVLSKTIEYINELLADRSSLLARLHTARSALPPGHPALTPLCQNVDNARKEAALRWKGDPNVPIWEREWKGGEDDEKEEGEEAEEDEDRSS